MKLSTTLTTNILNALCGKNNSGTSQVPKSDVTIGSYENCWLGLFYGEPTKGGTELSGHGYERVEIHELMNTSYQSYALGETSVQSHGRRIGNASQISFAEAIRSNILVDAEHGGKWATATHWAMFTSKSAASSAAIAWGELDEPITVDTHQVFIIRKGHLELYMEPDTEYVYFGAFADEAAFIAAIRASEELVSTSDPSWPAGLGRESVTERKMLLTETVTGKTMYYAYPVDFKGSPVFRDNGAVDEYGDMQYEEYASERSNTAPICKSYYVLTETEGETVVMADRSNAYYVHELYGIKEHYVACASQPSDWTTHWKRYYTHYVPVSGGSAPAFMLNTYYSYSNGSYTLLTQQPSDWATNWRDYYTYNSATYIQVRDASCPTFASDTYFGLEGLTGEISINVF